MLSTLAAASMNVNAIKTTVLSIDSIQIKSSLGAWHVYRKLVKDFSRIAKRFNNYLRKGEELDRSGPTAVALVALET